MKIGHGTVVAYALVEPGHSSDEYNDASIYHTLEEAQKDLVEFHEVADEIYICEVRAIFRSTCERTPKVEVLK